MTYITDHRVSAALFWEYVLLQSFMILDRDLRRKLLEFVEINVRLKRTGNEITVGDESASARTAGQFQYLNAGECQNVTINVTVSAGMSVQLKARAHVIYVI